VATGSRQPRPDPRGPGLTRPGRRPPVTPAEAKLGAAIAKQLRAAGPSSGALVYDLGQRAEVFGARAAIGRPPASVEKLWTTVALLRTLGPRARLHTVVVGAGNQRGGVWHGDLYLRGGGDPTFGDAGFNRFYNFGYGPTPTQLANQLRAHGIRRVTGHVIADESLFDRHRGGLLTGQLVDVPDFEGQLSALTYDHGTIVAHYSPATFAAQALAWAMGRAGIQAPASKRVGDAPRHGRVLAVVSSPPMSTMIRLMNVRSDDLFAESFAKQLGSRFAHSGTLGAGARVIARTIAGAYHLRPTILDGSGLSRQDRTSPAQIVDLLRDVWQTSTGDQLTTSLPVVGVNGTVRGIALKTPAAGHCLAKTGTLDNITNLAGYCHARGGHQLAFALFVDGPANGPAFWLESKMLAAIASY